MENETENKMEKRMAANNQDLSKGLSLKRIGIDTHGENVAYLHRDCAIYRATGFRALSKIEVIAGEKKIFAVLNVVDDADIVSPGQLALSAQAFAQIGLPDGAQVGVAPAERPASMDAVRRKIDGERLDAGDFRDIIGDIVGNRYSKTEIAAFIVSTVQNELDREEVLYLTEAMADAGDRINWRESMVADKHCIGGIPGNRTSMIVVPIVAAHGMLIPKTSSRAITSPAGTADTMEVLCEVDLPIERLEEIVRVQRGCLAWGGNAGMSPADDMLISVERPLSIDSRGQMVASILSKKLAAGATHLLIDIPVGPSAKVRHMQAAQSLRRLFEYVAGHLRIQIEVIITDGRQPVGRGIGPVLETRDVMQVLENDPAAPNDLRQKALRLAGRILEFDPDIRGGDGFTVARDILDSGRALDKMNAIIDAQGRRKVRPVLAGQFFDVSSPASGVVIAIDNFHLARAARFAGAPMEKGAGVSLFKKLGEAVTEGEPLYRVYSEHPAEFAFAKAHCGKSCGYQIGPPEHVSHVFVQP
jgi:thymidine phosphorylase